MVAGENPNGQGAKRTLGRAIVEAYKVGSLPHPEGGDGGDPGGGDGLPRRGTTAERNTLGGTLVPLDNNGHPFYDTDLQQQFVWWEGDWYQQAITPETANSKQVVFWVGTDAEILSEPYQAGHMWLDTTNDPNMVLRLCRADPVTNSMADWISVGRIN